LSRIAEMDWSRESVEQLMPDDDWEELVTIRVDFPEFWQLPHLDSSAVS